MMKNSYIERQIKKQKSNQEDDHGQPRNMMEGLPRDMVLDIVSRLPVKSIIRFRFVCRNFYNLSNDSDLVEMHLSRAVKSNNTCLIFHCDYPLSNQLYFVEFPDEENNDRVIKFHTPFSNSMPEFNVVGSCDGLLCLVNSLFSDVVYIYNPFTRQHKELPRSIEFQDQEVMYGFGFHPITMEYKVIKIIYYWNTYNASSLRLNRFIMRRYMRSEVQICSLGEYKWRSIGEIPYQLDRKSTVALVNGRLHWASKNGIYDGRHGKRIISFDIADELFREVPHPDCTNRTTLYGYHLAVLGGCLSVALPIRDRHRCLDIWIMKEYNVKESWVKQFCVEAYSPKLMNPELRQAYRIWKNVLAMRFVRVVCLLENGEILLEYKGGALAAYNPDSRTFKDLTFPGMPPLFQTIVHVGSLNWIG